jgi:hypothetical protein
MINILKNVPVSEKNIVTIHISKKVTDYVYDVNIDDDVYDNLKYTFDNMIHFKSKSKYEIKKYFYRNMTSTINLKNKTIEYTHTHQIQYDSYDTFCITVDNITKINHFQVPVLDTYQKILKQKIIKYSHKSRLVDVYFIRENDKYNKIKIQYTNNNPIILNILCKILALIDS